MFGTYKTRNYMVLNIPLFRPGHDEQLPWRDYGPWVGILKLMNKIYSLGYIALKMKIAVILENCYNRYCQIQ